MRASSAISAPRRGPLRSDPLARHAARPATVTFDTGAAAAARASLATIPALRSDAMARRPAVFPAAFYPALFGVGLATFVVHEFAHWATGVALGHEMVATLNSVSSVGAVSTRDQGLIAAAGPAITLAQGLLGLWLAWARRSHLGFALLYSAFFMRLVAAGVSVFHPNDEARVSQLLGLGTWTLPALVVGGLLLAVAWASRRLRLGWREQALCYLATSLAISAIVGADMLLTR